MADLQQSLQRCAQARQFLKSAYAMKGSKALVLKAVDLYEQVLQEHGQELPEPYFGLAYIAYAGGQPETALRFLQAGLQLSPEHPRMRSLLARAHKAAQTQQAQAAAKATTAAHAAAAEAAEAGPPPQELVSDLGPEQNADKISRGPEVEMLQRALQKLGHAVLVTGSYDRPTYAAVRNLQSLYKLPVTGFVDAVLRAQLNPVVRVVLAEQVCFARLLEIVKDFAQAIGQDLNLFVQQMVMELLELLLSLLQDFPSEAEEPLQMTAEPHFDLRENLSSRLGNMGQMGIVSKGLEVMRLQQVLLNLGYQVKVNQQFDLQTFSELSRFQLDQGLPITGIVEGPTREKLNQFLQAIFHEEAAQEALFHEIRRFQAELTLQLWPTLEQHRHSLTDILLELVKVGRLPELPTELVPYFQLQSELGPANRPGKVSQGREVRLLQQVLRKLAYTKVEINGNYDPETYNAVRSFQISKKLPMTGMVESKTREELNALVLHVLSRAETAV